MSYYGGTVTVAGRNLITRLIAGDTIQFTRVVVGSGEMPEGKEPIDMEELVQPIADATSTAPIVDNGSASMVVEYRNDMNGGLKAGFWLREFGVFAKTASTEEVLLYYATLGDSPQPVSAYQDNRIDIRRYPISIALEIDAEVTVLYDTSAFVTSKNVQDLVVSEIRELAEEGQLVTEENVARIVEAEVAKHPGGGYSSIIEVTLPVSGWKKDLEPSDDHDFICDINDVKITKEMAPVGACLPGYFGIAGKAGVLCGCETFDGFIRFYSKYKPEGDIRASVTLFGKGHSGGGGDVDAGDGLVYGPDGKLAVKIGYGLSFDEDRAVTADQQAVVTDKDMLDEGETKEDLKKILLTGEGQSEASDK